MEIYFFSVRLYKPLGIAMIFVSIITSNLLITSQVTYN